MYINSTNNSEEEQSWRAHTDFMNYKTTVIKSERIKKKKKNPPKQNPKNRINKLDFKIRNFCFSKAIEDN